jgi:uncharacterized protein YqeY
MSLKDRISEDMKQAMRAKDGARLDTIRLLRAAIQRREVDERVTLNDADVVAVVQKQIKQSMDAIAQFTAGARDDLAARERADIEVLQAYMPQQMDEREIDQHVGQALAQTGATGVRDMGKVMSLLKPLLQGKADMSQVSRKIKARLQD